MNRNIIFAAVTALTVGFLSCQTIVAHAEKTQPNILFIFTGDHALQAISAYAGPLEEIAPTPHLDAMAQGGLRFDRFYAAGPESHDGQKPLFLYLALPSSHTPWLTAKEFIGKSGAGMYGDFVMTVDSVFQRALPLHAAATP